MLDHLARTAVDKHGAQQDARELSMLLDVLGHRFPLGSVLEIGCDQGGGLYLWSHLATKVVGITLHTRLDGVFESHGATVIEGSSLNQDVRQAALMAGEFAGFDLVFVDGAHDYPTARRDIEWARTMAPYGLVVVHDIYRRDRNPEIETYLAWDRIREQLATVEICRKQGETPGYGILGLGK